MLYQNYSFEQSQNQIFSVLKNLQIAKLLYKANIRKGCGLSALEIFQRLVILLAKVYDHVFHEFVRGFNLLALGWSDGFSFIPVSFVLLSSAKLRNRYQEADKDIDHRTNGWKARMESMMQKPEAALRMVESALAAGIHADYILMDSWFTTEPFVKSLSDLGQDVIGMVKDMKQRYY